MAIEIHPMPRTLPEDLRHALAEVSLATIGHLLEEGFVDPGVRALVTPAKMVGRAITVRTTPPDSALVHAAVAMLEPGDALVIDIGGDGRHACVGEMVALAAQCRGAAGIVVDGVCTDIVEIRAMGLAVFARGTSLLTTKLLGLRSGTINGAITCGGVIVRPGDAVLGDANGVLILPPEIARWAAEEARPREAREPGLREHLRGGGSLAEWSGADRMVAQATDSGRARR